MTHQEFSADQIGTRRLSSGLPASLAGGDASKMRLFVEWIQIQDGQRIALPREGVTLILGPNNSSKSTLLSDIARLLRRRNDDPMPTSSDSPLKVRLGKGLAGSGLDNLKWLAERLDLTAAHDDSLISNDGNGLSLEELRNNWERRQVDNPYLYVNYVDLHSRWTALRPVDRRDNGRHSPEEPLHYFEDDVEAMGALSRITHTTFGETLVLDDSRKKLLLRLGSTQKPSEFVGFRERSAFLEALPRVDQQGDGIRSFVGTLLSVVGRTVPVTIIDEPDALLDPPQAYLMGEQLGQFSKDRPGQLIVATHNAHFIRGMLATPGLTLTIMHLVRHGHATIAHVVDAAKIAQIASHPILRYTQVLDAFFHRIVVLCENERDCVFYRAALEHLEGRRDAQTSEVAEGVDTRVPNGTQSNGKSDDTYCEAKGPNGSDPVPPATEREDSETLSRPNIDAQFSTGIGLAANDVLFFPTSGKSGMPKIVELLDGSGVPIVACVDLDLLSKKQEFDRLAAAFHLEDTDRLTTLYDAATADLKTIEPPMASEVAIKILRILDSEQGGKLNHNLIQRVRSELKLDGWKKLKTMGIDAMAGDTDARDGLLDLLEEKGIVLVRQGELESLCPECPRSSKSVWFERAMERRAFTRADAQAHIRRIVERGLELEQIIVRRERDFKA